MSWVNGNWFLRSSCMTYFLAKKGAAVTLVEKSSVACAAFGKASGKAGRFLALDWCNAPPSIPNPPMVATPLCRIGSMGRFGAPEPSGPVRPWPKFTPALHSYFDFQAIKNYGVEVVIGKLESVEVEETQESESDLGGMGPSYYSDVVVLARRKC
uniref:FAD dependent oxidoreductase domain-containing protein n=1 Tax=Fagus sylvatica TaxID=28930 RepID=A0A2N9FH67_FAGSY